MQSNIRAVESRILVAILGGIAVDEGDVGKNYSTNLYSNKSSHYVNSIVDAKEDHKVDFWPYSSKFIKSVFI